MGHLYYRHRAERVLNSGTLYTEVLVIREQDEQRRIIKSTHIGSGNSHTARCLGSRLGIDRTRAKILERLYWKNVGMDAREFILACDRCQKVNLVLKIDVGELHVGQCYKLRSVSLIFRINEDSRLIYPEVMVQIWVDITNLPSRGWLLRYC